MWLWREGLIVVFVVDLFCFLSLSFSGDLIEWWCVIVVVDPIIVRVDSILINIQRSLLLILHTFLWRWSRNVLVGWQFFIQQIFHNSIWWWWRYSFLLNWLKLICWSCCWGWGKWLVVLLLGLWWVCAQNLWFWC